MRQRLFDIKTGAPAGFVDIPDEIVVASQRVYDWMRTNGATEMCGLRLRQQVDDELKLLSIDEQQHLPELKPSE